MSPALLGKLVVVGVGLIGGSFALALRRSGAAARVIGVGRSRGNLEAAQRRGIVDGAYTLDQAWTVELVDADLVLLATPVGQMPSLFAAIAGSVGAHTVLTDAGSTKQDVVAAARANLAGALPRFVPGHPVAGTEHSGAPAAFDGLFRDKQVVLTPLSETAPDALARVSACWTRCGALVRHLEPARHDAIFAAVSHLPHALAFALVAELAARPDADECFTFAGSGLRDFTRLASSQAEMWRDVCLANRAALRSDLRAYRDALGRVDALLAAADGEALLRLFERARSARAGWLERTRGGDEV
jgi:prephenate dehydrogenase